MQTENYKFFAHTACEFYPCHAIEAEETFNCLFCYCPLYALGEQCGGHFTYTQNGIKDCSHCKVPHSKGGYEHVMEKFRALAELARKSPDGEKTE